MKKNNAENQNIEWKESWRDEFMKTVSAFANANGGVIEIGKNDRGDIVGLADTHKLMEDIPNKIRLATGVLADVDLHDGNGKHFISISIKPYPYPITYHGRYYYRSGSTTQELTGTAIDEFMLRKQGRTWDGVPVPYVSESEFERDAFRFFRKKAIESTRLTSEDLEISDYALLQNLMLIERDYLKRAAILLFHQNPEQWIPGAYAKIGFFENDADLIYQDEIHGPLLMMPDKILDTLYLKYFKGMISYRGTQRVETYPVPRASLREAVHNAVNHKDYSSGIPIQIRVYQDKVAIYNVGGLPDGWTVEKLLARHGSQPRNPLVAGTFFRSGLIESWGRGIEKIISSCREEGKDDPIFEASNSEMSVTFFDNRKQPPTKNFIVPCDTIIETINGAANPKRIESLLVEALIANPSITYDGLAKLLSVSRSTVSREIKKLIEDGKIEREGARRNGSWVVKG
ncbi:MAG: putative DNA binding domain-containing protein [Clostridiales Family XIII bacterium]|nr:putative DNA binding domain-containing protein [Clostridiales Family XIII bacterium]